MKKLFIILTALVVSCSLFADTTIYTVTWDVPAEQSLVMNIYQWSGTDTTQCPFFEGIPLNESSQYFVKSVDPYTGTDGFVGTADGKTYLSFVGQYKDVNGLYSQTAWATVGETNSHFRLSDDVTPPEKPANMKVQ